MSLAIKYETVDDARLRLRNTVVLYKGAPVFVTEISRETEKKDDIFRVMFKEIPLDPAGGIVPRVQLDVRGRIRHADPDEMQGPEEGKRKYISSKHFDIAPFKMGYVNRKEGTGAFYASRMPNRVQKQGLCMENFTGRDNHGKAVDFGTFIRSEGAVEMVAGSYPSFERACRLLEEGKAHAIAFHREFCLVKDEVIPKLVYLFHKGRKVGMFNKGEVTLGTKFVCLKESLCEMQLKVGAF